MSCDEARANKVKLTGDPVDAERVRALRRVRPDVWLGVDVNEGFRKQSLEALLPVLIEVRVELIEQPLPVGEEAQFNGMKCPIRIVADLSVRTLSDIPGLVSGIKLDRCGGLSYRLTMPRAARELWPEVMVDNMLRTSLGMGPAFLPGQFCRVLDLDGSVFLRTDREPRVDYVQGFIHCPEALRDLRGDAILDHYPAVPATVGPAFLAGQRASLRGD